MVVVSMAGSTAAVDSTVEAIFIAALAEEVADSGVAVVSMVGITAVAVSTGASAAADSTAVAATMAGVSEAGAAMGTTIETGTTFGDSDGITGRGLFGRDPIGPTAPGMGILILTATTIHAIPTGHTRVVRWPTILMTRQTHRTIHRHPA